MKLVINSSISYTVPLTTLLVSLTESDFDAFGDVIVVRGGAAQDRVGARRICDILPLTQCKQIVFVIDTTGENYDYHGFDAVYRFRHHDDVQSPWYFYVLDTVTVEPDFGTLFRHMSAKCENVPGDRPTIVSCALPNSNICIFNAALVLRYKGIFSTDKLTKKEAMMVECGHRVRAIKPLVAYAKVKLPLAPRTFVEQCDPYDTGFDRDKWHYPDLHLHKYILWGMTGEFCGDAFTY